MASADYESSDQYSLSYSDSDDQSGDDSGSEQGASGDERPPKSEPCKFYNSRDGCRNGRACHYLHVCKYSLKGSCREGHRCRLRHVADSDSDDSGAGERGGRRGSGGRRNPEARASTESARRPRRRSSSSGSELEDGEPYRWQLDCGRGWKSIENDHILEAHYSRPSVKGINLYNTPNGVISIDFKHMRVLKKKIRVRRLGSQQTKWLWYYKGRKRWYQYGEKDSKGNRRSIKSSAIEAQYQRNKKGSHQFTVGSDRFEIRFRDMCQENLSSGQKRKVCRRPLYESSQNHGRLTQGMRRMNRSGPAQGRWQFSGSGNKWHDYKQGACSVSSAEIEAHYQRNPQGCMSFTINGQPYQINFSTMTQSNKAKTKKRDVQRI